jgi:hypothetical protein
MVRKGSSVRVRQRAFPANRGFGAMVDHFLAARVVDHFRARFALICVRLFVSPQADDCERQLRRATPAAGRSVVMPPTSPTREGDAANLRLGAHGHQRPAPSSRPEPRGGTERREPHARCREGWPVAEGATISGWREDRQAEGLGLGDHALVVGDHGPELTRNACGRGEMNRVERSQCRRTDLRCSRHYRLDRKQSQPGEYGDGNGRSLTAEAPCGPGDLDRGEQA